MDARRGRLEDQRTARSGIDQNPRANNPTQVFFQDRRRLSGEYPGRADRLAETAEIAVFC
jgi:hypothetical protein